MPSRDKDAYQHENGIDFISSVFIINQLNSSIQLGLFKSRIWYR
jgi:hypothetical protein